MNQKTQKENLTGLLQIQHVNFHVASEEVLFILFLVFLFISMLLTRWK